MRRVGARRRRLLAEAGRFAAVGGVATLVALLLFNAAVHGLLLPRAPLADQPILAYVLANCVGMVLSYHGSRVYAFRDRPSRHRDGGLTAFVVINLATMLIPIACLSVSRDVLGLTAVWSDNLAANGVGLLLGLMARFWLFRTLVFQRPISLVEMYDEPPSPGPSHEAALRPVEVAWPTAMSRSDPVAPPAPGAAAG